MPRKASYAWVFFEKQNNDVARCIVRDKHNKECGKVLSLKHGSASTWATSASSERVFKAADDHITHDRNRLKPENGFKLIFMQQALKKLDMSLYDLCYNSENCSIQSDSRWRLLSYDISKIDYANADEESEREREELEIAESDAATEGDENDGLTQFIHIDDDVTVPNEHENMYQ